MLTIKDQELNDYKQKMKEMQEQIQVKNAITQQNVCCMCFHSIYLIEYNPANKYFHFRMTQKRMIWKETSISSIWKKTY